jgi:hypothetical protein
MAESTYSAVDKERRKNFFEVPATVRMYDERRIIDFVMERVRQAQEGVVYRNIQDNYGYYRRAYEGKFENTSDIPKWRNRLYVRLSFKIVETLRAYFDDAFFGREPYIMVEPRYHVWKEAAKNMESVMAYHAFRTRKRRKMQSVFNSVLKHGIGVTRSFWNFQRGVMPVRQFDRDESGFLRHFGMEEKPYVKMDSPDFKWVDPTRVAFDPLNWETENMRYGVEEFDMDFDDLWNTKDRYGWMNLAALESSLRSGFPASNSLSRFGINPFATSDYIGAQAENSLRTFDHTRKRVNILRYEGKLDLPGNQEDPRMYEIYIANDNHLILLQRSQYSFDKLSYNIFGIIPKEDSPAGIGAIEPILTDQRILNILVNVRLDSLHLLISPRLLRHKNAMEQGINNIANVAPGGFIDVKSAQDLRQCIVPLEMPDQAFSTWHQFWQMQNQHAEETLAMNPNARGMLAQEKHSATEVVRALESANARFLHMVNYFSESGYQEQAAKESSMIQQLQEQELQVKVTGDPSAGDIYRRLAPWDVQGDFMFKRHDPTKANKEQEAQLWANLLAAFAPYFQLLQQTNPAITPIPFLRGILEASPVFNKLDINKVLPEVSPAAQAFLGQQNPMLEQALGGNEAAGGGTMPGGGTPPMQQQTIPQGEATAAGIAAGM